MGNRCSCCSVAPTHHSESSSGDNVSLYTPPHLRTPTGSADGSGVLTGPNSLKAPPSHRHLLKRSIVPVSSPPSVYSAQESRVGLPLGVGVEGDDGKGKGDGNGDGDGKGEGNGVRRFPRASVSAGSPLRRVEGLDVPSLKRTSLSAEPLGAFSPSSTPSASASPAIVVTSPTPTSSLLESSPAPVIAASGGTATPTSTAAAAVPGTDSDVVPQRPSSSSAVKKPDRTASIRSSYRREDSSVHGIPLRRLQSGRSQGGSRFQEEQEASSSGIGRTSSRRTQGDPSVVRSDSNASSGEPLDMIALKAGLERAATGGDRTKRPGLKK